MDSNSSFITSKLEWLCLKYLEFDFSFIFRGWTINISVEKSSAVKLAMSSKASGRKKLQNRLVMGNWKKIDREGVPWESMWIVSLLFLEVDFPRNIPDVEMGETNLFSLPTVLRIQILEMVWSNQCSHKTKGEWGLEGRHLLYSQPSESASLHAMQGHRGSTRFLTDGSRQKQRKRLCQSLYWDFWGKVKAGQSKQLKVG